MNLFILGAYGQKNTGDESLLVVMRDQLRKRGHELVFNSHHPRETSQMYGVKAVFTYPWQDFLTKIKVLLWCDAVVYGGGTILAQDPRMLFFMALGNLPAKLLGKKVVYLGVGVGNLRKSRASQILVRIATIFADLVTLRDQECYQQLEKIGAHKKATVTADPVLLLKAAEEHPGGVESLTSGVGESAASNHQPTIGLSFRYMVPDETYQKALNALAKLIPYLIDKYQARIVLLPIQHSIKHSRRFTGWKYDDAACRELHGRLNSEAWKVKNEQLGRVSLIEDELSPGEVQSLIGSFDLYISAPLHSLMFAAMQGTPMIALDYSSAFNQKIKQFMKSVNQEEYYLQSYDDVTYETLKKLIQESIANKKERRKTIDEATKPLIKKAGENFTLLEKVLAKK